MFCMTPPRDFCLKNSSTYLKFQTFRWNGKNFSAALSERMKKIKAVRKEQLL